MIGKLLGHTQAQTTQRYAHLVADPVRNVAETVGARLAPSLAPRLAK
jgi:site-specific recombinase XerD